jgi:hypothetical protein
MRKRVREIIRQTCAEMGAQIIKGVLSTGPYVRVDPAASGSLHGDATDQRAVLTAGAVGISRASQTVLG